MKLQWQAVPNIDKVWRWSCSKAGDRIQAELAELGDGDGDWKGEHYCFTQNHQLRLY